MTYPKERVTYMVEDSQPAAIITLSNLTNQLSETTRKICLDTESVSIADCETRKPGLTSQNDILAYIIYTSGSTGRPKGTMNVHSGIVNYLTFMKRKFQFCPADRIVQFTSFSFDVSTFEIFLTLSSGGTLFVMDDTQVRDPNYIYTKMVDVQATYLSCVPTMLRALCESAFAGQPKENTLRLILPAGEPLRGVDVVLTRKAFGNAALLVNQYGPTECSIIQTTYNIPDALPNGLQTVPIGKPIDNARMYVLDSYFHPVPPGAKGELFIGGVCVGPGYWKLPEQTMDRFQPDPFFPGGRIYRTGDVVRQLQDGTICYLGRSDNQVKIRGYRVELGEIESVVNEFPGVKDAVVILWRREDSETLAAYITIAEGYRGLDLDQLHASLAERLPFYMRPSFVRIMNEMPLTPTRKIDRRALPPPESGLTTDRYIAPRNETESRLVSIWQEILEVERIGVRDNFFELGGHSLLAVRLFTRIQEEFGQSLPLMLLFQEGSVEATARALAGDAKLIHPQGIIPIQPRGSELPIFIISAGLYMRELAMALGSSRPVYGLDSTQNGEVEYRKSVQETARIYCDNLIHFYPQGPYILLGHSGHGFFTLELARLLIRTGHDVAFLGLLDTYPPEIGRKANPVNWVKRYASNFKNKNLRKTLQFLGNSVQHFIARRLGRAGMENRIMDQYKMQGKGKKIRRLLLDSYHPEAFDGHVKIFTCAIRPSFMQRDSMQEWAHFITGQLEFVQIPGDHMSALHSPHVAFLADKIEAFLPHRKNDQR
jgi:aspartate racemase